MQDCPRDLEGGHYTSSGFPDCTCLYGGTITWDTAAQSWNE